MSSSDDVQKQVEQRLAELSQKGVAYSAGIAYADGKPTVFVTVSVQTDHLAADYDKAAVDVVRRKIRAALGSIPFQILGDYSENSQEDLASAANEHGKCLDQRGIGQPQQLTLGVDAIVDRSEELPDYATVQHLRQSNSSHEAVVPDDAREKLEDITARVTLLEKALGIVSLQFRAAQNDPRESQELSSRVARLEHELPRLASRRFVITEGYIIIVIATILIIAKDEIQNFALLLFSLLRSTVGI